MKHLSKTKNRRIPYWISRHYGLHHSNRYWTSSPSGSTDNDGVEEYTTNLDPLNNVNVLGLGDRFAATVLNYMTISKLHISDLVNRSHMDMSTWLERR